jgi:outer membrane protein OmpA-like peptidoglycan-associated protein
LYNQHLWLGRLSLVFLVLLLVLSVVRVSLPYTIVYSAVYWLGQQGITSQIEDIDIDVTKGTFAIINASGHRNGDVIFKIGKASIDWRWRPLAKKTIHVKEITLETFDLQLRQYTDALVVAGVEIRQDGSIEPQPEAEEQSVAWSTALDRINFKDLAFCYQQFNNAINNGEESKRIDYCGNIDQLSWEGQFGLGDTNAEAQNELILTADGSLNVEQLNMYNNMLDGTLIDIGDLAFSTIKINGINDIHLDRLGIARFALLQDSGHSKHKHAVEFDTLDLSGIQLKNARMLAIDSIALNKPTVSVAKDSKGDWKFERWLLQSTETETTPTADDETQANNGEPVSVQLGDVTITDAEACYQQPALAGSSDAVDYCLSLADIKWSGAVGITTAPNEQPAELDINGNVVLVGLEIANNILKRDLLTFKQLEISKLDVNSIEDLSFDALDLADINGLELSQSENTHTISINNVNVSSFKYGDRTLTIDKVAINDLGLDLTQTADGSLDIEQWKVETTDETTASETEKANSDTDPIKISLGEFSLDTKRTVQFTDKSVTPNMQIGFKQFVFNVKNLDSANPQQESPIELVANTLRHGTIEIKGVVMPFESKPSFDATGKITGVDLRVASPKAEQAIGHIIKSGQLDADLKLLSEQGQLDSNIALVLHHFNLKAKSKEDAAALDETFGMPINQSLVLLKDKKNRIKLDIPITGDINDPSFNPADAIVKATAKATTVTLITFYTPYGLAFAGGNVLFNMATAMNFDPLTFKPGSAQLDDAHNEQLAKLAELLVERPHVHLTLCGFTNLIDRDKLFTEIIDKDKIKPASAERLQKLKQLGSERQQAVKNQLIEVGKITHDRLILCEPEHNDDTESLAGVEISI